MENLNRRDALIALGAAIAGPSVAGPAAAASPGVAPRSGADGLTITEIDLKGNELGIVFLSHQDRMSDPIRIAAFERVLNTDTEKPELFEPERFGWNVLPTEEGIDLYLKGPDHEGSEPNVRTNNRFLVRFAGRTHTVRKVLALKGYATGEPDAPLLTVVKFRILPRGT